MLTDFMLRPTAEAISAAVTRCLGKSLHSLRMQMAQDIAKSQRRRKGARNRSILSARVEEGVLHTFHATKGPRKRRIASPDRRAI